MATFKSPRKPEVRIRDSAPSWSFSQTNVAENILTLPDHGLETGDRVFFEQVDGNSNIGGLKDGGVYYVIKIGDNQIKLAATKAAATNETPEPIELTASSASGNYILKTRKATIDALAVAGSAGGAYGSGTSVGLAGAGAGAENTVVNTVKAYISDSDRVTSTTGSVTVHARDASFINADVVGGSISIGISTGGNAGSLAVGVSVARNQMTSTLEASITDSTVHADAGGMNVQVLEDATIMAMSVAAAVSGSVSSSGGNALALSGGGAEALNDISSDANAFVKDSTITASDDVQIIATNNSTIEADVYAIAASGSVGNNAISAAIGGARAVNTVRGKLDNDKNQVRAFIEDSSVTVTSGSLVQIATSNQEIDAVVGAGSIALSGASNGLALGLSGAGAQAINDVGMDVQAYIDNTNLPDLTGSTDSSKIQIDVRGNLTLNAFDVSAITVVVGAGSIAASFAATGPSVSIAIGVALAENTIQNDVKAYLSDVDGVDVSGSIAIDALESANITSTTVAAAVAVSVASTFGVALSGAGANATNKVNNQVHASIDDSTSVIAGQNIEVQATSNATVTSLVGAVAASVGVGTTSAASLALGVSLARNLIGFESHLQDSATENASQVRASISNSDVTATDGFIHVFATSNDTVAADAFAGSVAISAGASGVALSGAGVEITNRLGTELQASIQDSDVKTENRVSGNLDVKATSSSEITKANATGVAVAAVIAPEGVALSIAASIVDNRIVNTVDAFIAGTAENRIDVAGSLQVLADSFKANISNANAVTAAVSIGLIGASGGGVDIDNVVANNIHSSISGPLTVTAGSDLNVEATERAAVSANATGITASLAAVSLVIGVSLVDNEINSSTIAGIGESGHPNDGPGRPIVTAKNIRVNAESVANISRTDSLAIGGGVIGIGVNTANAIVDTTVDASVFNAQLNSSSGNIEVTADSGSTALADVDGYVLGLGVGVGVVASNAEIKGTTTASAQGQLTAIQGEMSVLATSLPRAEATATAAAGGLTAVGVNTTTAKINRDVTAEIAADSIVNADGAVEVRSIMNRPADINLKSAKADTLGIDIGALAVGSSVANVFLQPTITSDVGSGVQIMAQTVVIDATSNLGQGWANSTAGSGKFIGATLTRSEQTVDVDVRATVGVGARVTGRDSIALHSNAGTTDLYNYADAYVVSAASGQDATAKETINTTASTEIGQDASLFSLGHVSVGSQNKIDVESLADTVYVGGIGVSAALTQTNISGFGSETNLAKTTLGSGSTITARDVDMDAVVTGLAVTSETSGWQVAIGGGVLTTSDVTVSDANAKVETFGSINADIIDIQSRHEELSILSHGEAHGVSLELAHDADFYDAVTLVSTIAVGPEAYLRGNQINLHAEAAKGTTNTVKQESRNFSESLLGDWAPDNFELSFDAKAIVDVAGTLVPGSKSARLIVNEAGEVIQADYVEVASRGNSDPIVILELNGSNAIGRSVADADAIPVGITIAAESFGAVISADDESQTLEPGVGTDGDFDVYRVAQTGSVNFGESVAEKVPDRFLSVFIENRSSNDLEIRNIDVGLVPQWVTPVVVAASRNAFPARPANLNDFVIGIGDVVIDAQDYGLVEIKNVNAVGGDIFISGDIKNQGTVIDAAGTTEISSAGGSIVAVNGIDPH